MSLNQSLAEAKKPNIRIAPPGPLTRKALKRDASIFAPCYARPYPLVAERGAGMWLEDLDGNVYLDCTAGIAVNSTGHCHPEVVEAIREQAGKLMHMSGTDWTYKIQIDLAERLSALVPGRDKYMAYLCNSGTEAIEAGLKLARFASKRPQFIAFTGAFHGRTMGALSATASKVVQREGYFPLVPGVTHIPYPDTYRPPFHCDPKTVGDEVLYYLVNTVLKKLVAPSELAGIIFECVQGEGGYVLPPKDFFRKLRKICDLHGALMIADEVQSGMGRTGKMFGFEHFGIVPDIICTAKGIASGLPLGATLARADLMKDWGPGRQGTTFGGNPVACAASHKTLDLLQGGYMKNAGAVGKYMLEQLRRRTKSCKAIGEVRGLGLMIAVECVKDKKTREYHPDFAAKVVRRCFEKGLLLLRCGMSGIRFSPSLCITRKEVDLAVDIFAGVVKSIR